MMQEQKNIIDEYFRDRLFDHEMPAPPEMWKKIDNQLRQNKTRVYWIIAASIAASGAILISIGIGYYLGFNHKMNVSKNFNMTVNSNPKIINKKTNINLSSSGKNNVSSAGINTNKVYQKQNFISDRNPEKINSLNNGLIFKKLVASNEKAGKKVINKNGQQILILSPLKPIEIVLLNNISRPNLKISEKNIDALLGIEGTNDVELEIINKPKNSWAIGGNVAPLFSNIENNKSVFSSEYYNITEKPVFALAGGLNVNYETGRWQFESGIVYSESGQKTDFELLNSSLNKPGTDQLVNTFDYIKGNVKINLNRPGNVLSYGSVSSGNSILNMPFSTIEQQYRYVEIPFIAHYKILNKKTILSLSGGISANILVGNQAYLENKSNSYSMGSVEGTETFNYAGILGLAYEVPLINRLSLKLEPRFRYNINSMNKNNDLNNHPYSMGIFSGVSYHF